MSPQEFKQLADRTFWAAHDRTFLNKRIVTKATYRGFKGGRSLDPVMAWTCEVDYLSSRDSFRARVTFSDCVGDSGYRSGESWVTLFHNGRVAKVANDVGKPAVLTRIDPPVRGRPGRGQPREPWNKLDVSTQILDGIAIGFLLYGKYAPETPSEFASTRRPMQITRQAGRVTVRATPLPDEKPQRTFTTEFRNSGHLRLDRHTMLTPVGETVWVNTFAPDGRPKRAEHYTEYQGGGRRRFHEVEVLTHEDANPGPEEFTFAQFGLPEFDDSVDPQAARPSDRTWLIVVGVLLLIGGALWFVRRSRA